MSECRNPETRDRLPELAAAGADAPGYSDVRQHLSACESCRRELAVLARVRAAVAASAPAPVDTARIAGAVRPYQRRPSWRRMASSGQFRAAAAVILVAGALAVGHGGREPARPDSVVATASPARPLLAIGDSFADLSDADLRELAAEFGQLEAVTPTETDVLDVPAVMEGAGGGGSA